MTIIIMIKIVKKFFLGWKRRKFLLKSIEINFCQYALYSVSVKWKEKHVCLLPFEDG